MDRINNHTQVFCGEDCNDPPELPYSRKIDLKDGVKLLLDKNPSKIITNNDYAHYFIVCKMADQNLFPVLGGFYEQPTMFLELYEEYVKWRDAAEKVREYKAFQGVNKNE